MHAIYFELTIAFGTLNMMIAIAVLALINAILAAVLVLRKNTPASIPPEQIMQLESRITSTSDSLSSKFAASTADLATRLEATKGDLRQQITDRLTDEMTKVRNVLDVQLKSGREEQGTRLDAAISQLETRFEALRSGTESKLGDFAKAQSDSLQKSTTSLETKFEQLNLRQSESLEAIRGQVDQKLLDITERVQQKLDENIKEGFAQFEKVQEHLKAAEEQLRNVGTIGTSINDLNNLLKLPHLRGKFGESSLERLLADFLPASMYELQSGTGTDQRRADAMILFPDRKLPVDAKFPREQVTALFENKTEAELVDTRKVFEKVIKTEATRISGYIQPEHGTTDMALMYLPSETLYFEVIRNRDLSEWLNQQKVFPVSPNTLLMSLQTISLVYRWYQVAKSFEKTTQELAKAQKSFGLFQAKFETVGKQLEKAQEAYSTATTHLTRYRGKVIKLTGEEVPELEGAEQANLLSESTDLHDTKSKAAKA
jgi:DNA recombination protein RmuC